MSGWAMCGLVMAIVQHSLAQQGLVYDVAPFCGHWGCPSWLGGQALPFSGPCSNLPPHPHGAVLDVLATIARECVCVDEDLEVNGQHSRARGGAVQSITVQVGSSSQAGIARGQHEQPSR